MDSGVPQTLLKCLKMRRHYYIEVRDLPAYRLCKMYHCILCNHSATDDKSLVDHLKSDAHKKNLNFAKLTLLKRNVNRWPFNDGVLLFDSSIKEEEMSYLEKQQEFKDYPEGFKILKDCLKSVDNDDALTIERFEYDPEIVNPRVKAYSGRFLIRAHGDTLKIGKSQIFGRHDSNGGIDKIWCEWIGKDDNDRTTNEVNDDDNLLIRVVIMRFRSEISYGFCGICSREIHVGRDVASLLEAPGSSFGKIVCCNLGARNKSSRTRFHTFHTSCLLQWILWCEYAQRVKLEDVTDIYNLFCPDCNKTRDGECYDKSEMDKVKSMILQAKNEWTKNPEILQNSSIGLHFPLQYEDTKKEVKFLKLVQFYRAEYEIPDFPTKIGASMT